LQRDELYLADIIEAADAIASFIAGVEEGDFAGNDLLHVADHEMRVRKEPSYEGARFHVLDNQHRFDGV